MPQARQILFLVLARPMVFRAGIFFFNDTATTEIYTLSLHDALPISPAPGTTSARRYPPPSRTARRVGGGGLDRKSTRLKLQSPMYLVCRLLLEKKKKKNHNAE